MCETTSESQREFELLVNKVLIQQDVLKFVIQTMLFSTAKSANPDAYRKLKTSVLSVIGAIPENLADTDSVRRKALMNSCAEQFFQDIEDDLQDAPPAPKQQDIH